MLMAGDGSLQCLINVNRGQWRIGILPLCGINLPILEAPPSIAAQWPFEPSSPSRVFVTLGFAVTFVIGAMLQSRWWPGDESTNQPTTIHTIVHRVDSEIDHNSMTTGGDTSMVLPRNREKHDEKKHKQNKACEHHIWLVNQKTLPKYIENKVFNQPINQPTIPSV